MTLALMAAVPAVVLTAAWLYEKKFPTPLRARAARSTINAALRRGGR
jgi:hypothetical protein